MANREYGSQSCSNQEKNLMSEQGHENKGMTHVKNTGDL